MGMTKEQLAYELLGLSAAERGEMAALLIRSLDEKADEDVDSAWMNEIMRRRQEALDGKAEMISAEEVFRELESGGDT